VVDGLVVKVLRRNDLVDNLFLDLLTEVLDLDMLVVLGTDNNSVNAKRDNGTTIVLVLDGNLGLGVRPEPLESAVLALSRHLGVQGVCKLEGERKEFGGLVSGITEHDTLVTSTELLKSLIVVKTLSDIGGLGLESVHDVASLVVETLGGVIVANVLDSIANSLLVVDLSLGGDFAKDENHTSLGSGLASDLGERVSPQAGIEDGIGDLVGNLVGMTLTDRLGGEKESALVGTVTVDDSNHFVGRVEDLDSGEEVED